MKKYKLVLFANQLKIMSAETTEKSNKQIYGNVDVLAEKPRLGALREDIKTLFDSIRNFTISFAFLNIVLFMDSYIPTLGNYPYFTAWLMTLILFIANALFLANCYWFYTNSKLRNISKARAFSTISGLFFFVLLYGLWWLYTIDQIFPKFDGIYF
ncbi:hypothetical protein [Planctobacterium marinum]|uniref:hypothetical protein n=1 Tax=Planctobacterium marinum TaxID=1631968 RepID=UPI001E31E6BD|nr:hypothetical protein [Planctobacterium marinum]MCC2604417.1 hypothetical protein [Planctobacterium marinum]